MCCPVWTGLLVTDWLIDWLIEWHKRMMLPKVKTEIGMSERLHRKNRESFEKTMRGGGGVGVGVGWILWQEAGRIAKCGTSYLAHAMGQEYSTHSTYYNRLRSSCQETWRDNSEDIIVDWMIKLRKSSERGLKMRAAPFTALFARRSSDETSDYIQGQLLPYWLNNQQILKHSGLSTDWTHP